MAAGRTGNSLDQIQTLWSIGTLTGLDERQLLEEFVAGKDSRAEAAFEAIVRRHGPMVLRVCRQLLCDSHAAEDAFQTAFLILARKAGSLRRPDLLSQWLYGVAVRTARKERWKRESHKRREQTRVWSADDEPIGACGRDEERLIEREQAEALHQELACLPEKYRLPVILCDLEGQTHQEAARRLGWPVGTVSVRVMRARELLRARLTRRGFAPAIGLSATGAAREALSAALPAALVDKTLVAVMSSLRGQAVPLSSVTTSALGIAWSTLRMPVVGRLRAAVSLCCAVAVGTFVGVSLARLLCPEDDLDARAAAFAAQFARLSTPSPPVPTPTSTPAPASARVVHFPPAPAKGYHWVRDPYPGQRSAPVVGPELIPSVISGYYAQIQDGSIVFTIGHRIDPKDPGIRDVRPVVFDSRMTRYLPRWEWTLDCAGESGERAALSRFRLSPDVMAADELAFLGIEQMSYQTRQAVARKGAGSPPRHDREQPALSPPKSFAAAPDFSWAIAPRRIGDGNWRASVSGERGSVVCDVLRDRGGSLLVSLAYPSIFPWETIPSSTAEYRPVLYNLAGDRYVPLSPWNLPQLDDRDLEATDDHSFIYIWGMLFSGAGQLTSPYCGLFPDYHFIRTENSDEAVYVRLGIIRVDPHHSDRDLHIPIAFNSRGERRRVRVRSSGKNFLNDVASGTKLADTLVYLYPIHPPADPIRSSISKFYNNQVNKFEHSFISPKDIAFVGVERMSSGAFQHVRAGWMRALEDFLRKGAEFRDAPLLKDYLRKEPCAQPPLAIEDFLRQELTPHDVSFIHR